MAVGELRAEEQKMTRKEASPFMWLHNHVLHVEGQVRTSDTRPTMSLLPTAQEVLGRGGRVRTQGPGHQLSLCPHDAGPCSWAPHPHPVTQGTALGGAHNTCLLN